MAEEVVLGQESWKKTRKEGGGLSCGPLPWRDH